MSLDLSFDDGQQALADATAAFCRDHCGDDVVRATGTLPRAVWRGLAELGVFALGCEEEEGGTVEIVAVCEALGRAVFPGPVIATFLACQILPDSDRRRVASGEALVCVAVPPELPFGPEADVFIALDPKTGDAWRARPAGAITPTNTLGGETWGRGALERVVPLAGVEAAIRASEVARAAYLVAAARRLVDDAAEHARTRKQFGRAIGDFQAVAHPLADAAIALDAARTLARAAAWRIDRCDPDAAAWAAAANRSAARAALDTIHVAHQVFGAIGITIGGPAFPITRRIRQLVSTPLGAPESGETILSSFVHGEANVVHREVSA